MARASPGGSGFEPGAREMVYGPVPPWPTPNTDTILVPATKSPRYAVFTPPMLITAVGRPLMRVVRRFRLDTNRVNVLVSTFPFALLKAVTVILNVPVAKMVPERTPVLELIDKPEGCPVTV